MKTAFLTILLLISGLPLLVRGERGVECVLAVYQFDSTTSEDVLLLVDTTLFAEGVVSSAFLLAFSVEVNVEQIDSAAVKFTLHLLTLGPKADTYSHSFLVEYGLPARTGPLRVKENSTYRLVLTPLKSVEIDPDGCEFDHRSKGTFKFEPTAYTDLHYVPGSLADFYWLSIKNLMEEEYRRFRSWLNFSLPGKYQIFLCPCPIKSVIWDGRFGMANDPTRRTAYSIYSLQSNTTDPFVLLHTAVLYNYGYAPPLLSEGMANYYSHALYDLKKLAGDQTLPPLREMLKTYKYLTTEPELADRYSAVLVKYLIDRYGLHSFKGLYRAADDLNLASVLEQLYQLSVSDLEIEFMAYIDSARVNPDDLKELASRAETMLDHALAREYGEALLEIAENSLDTTEAYTILKRASFYIGDYEQAIESLERQLILDSTRALNWMVLGNYKMITGRYDSGFDDLQRALSIDPDYSMVQFNIALFYRYTGNPEEAEKLLREMIDKPGKTGLPGESRIMLAEILQQRNKGDDSTQAVRLFHEAVMMFSTAVQANAGSATAHVWLAIAHMGRGDAGNALQHLQVAEYIETRPLYHGLISLTLGKLADLSSDHEAAGQYYNRVLSGASADYHMAEARRYLKKPYTQ